MDKINIFWFRRDLRLEDHYGLFRALESGRKVLPVFIFDTHILDRLENPYDRRVDYIHQALQGIHTALREMGSGLKVFYGKPEETFKDLMSVFSIETVFCTNDYEPEALERDRQIAEWLGTESIGFISFKDQVIFERDDVMKSNGSPYTVFTSYAKKWKECLTEVGCQTYKPDLMGLLKFDAEELIPLERIGFKKTDLLFFPPEIDMETVKHYHLYRDFPAIDKTSHLGMALRFGTLSVRKCVKIARSYNEIWLNELIWREFFMQILYHFPHVVDHCFKPAYEAVAWRNNEEEFKAWCGGNTGYPLVDAGMHQLNKTGWMHNRVRMVTASFLTKHLLIDWRWGEAYFASKLLDYELASNNGNWQWAAGCGADAAPYFRIFNPDAQTQKFDKNLEYIRKWNPGFQDVFKTPPMVNHQKARERALLVYGAI